MSGSLKFDSRELSPVNTESELNTINAGTVYLIRNPRLEIGKLSPVIVKSANLS